MKNIIRFVVVILLLIFGTILLLGGGFGSKDDYPTLNQGKPIVFAHRGATDLSVENSSESFERSEQLGFKAIETDINCTKDGKLIVFHDDNCKRILDLDCTIHDVNWKDLRDKPLFYKGKKTKNKILTLRQFLQQSHASKILYLDIKKSKKSIADSLLVLMEEFKNHKNIIIADENILFLAYLKSKNPTIKIALEGFNKGKEWLHYGIPKSFKPDFYASFLSKIDKNHMLFLKKNNLIKNKIVYGVTHKNISKVLDFGIQNIIIDYDASLGNIQEIEEDLSKTNSIKYTHTE